MSTISQGESNDDKNNADAVPTADEVQAAYRNSLRYRGNGVGFLPISNMALQKLTARDEILDDINALPRLAASDS